MKTQYYTASTLDGFVATLDHSVAWLDALGDPEQSSYPEFIAEVGAIAMGSGTYEWIRRYLESAPPSPDGTPAQWPYRQPTWVFSSRERPAVTGADVQFVQGDVRPVHRVMCERAGGRNLWIAGGGDLAGQFLDAGLLDELIVQVGSLTLGSGMPLLPRHLTTPMVLESARRMGTGFAELRYRVSR